ncbi:MAG: hypothetical protein IIA70_01785 [Proteobacteria bacterium]|nr:hypothetical protein [Pseudomonadota bacterium]
MIKRPQAKKNTALPEAEIRLQTALDRLSGVIRVKQASHADVKKLRHENTELDERFKSLKGEYEVLERSLGEMKDYLKSISKKTPSGDSTAELSKDQEWSAAAHGPDPETEFLKNELERVHKEYKSLDQSFKLLRSQYNELQETYQEALDDTSAELDLLTRAGVSSAPGKSNGGGELKRDLGAQLDKTIAALEKLVN